MPVIANKPQPTRLTLRPVAAIAIAVVALSHSPALAQDHRISIPTQTAKPPDTPQKAPQIPGAKHIPGKAGQLSEQRFLERGYGLSFAAPADSYQVLQTADGSIVKYLCSQHVTISFAIKHSGKSVKLGGHLNGSPEQKNEIGPQTKPITIGLLLKRAADQFGYAHPSAARAKDPNPRLKIAGQPGAKIYFVVPEDKGPSWVAGQAFVILGPRTVAMFQMQCAADDFDQNKKLFEKLLASAKLQDPEKLNAERRRQLADGVQWLHTVTNQKIDRALHKTHWFRIVQGQKDVGYERITASEHRELGEKGVQVLKQLHIEIKKTTYVSVSSYFASRDGSIELWSVRSASHQGGVAKHKLPHGQTPLRDEMWVETGIRSGDRLTIKRQTPSRHTTRRWEKPANGYLSQVAAQLLMGMLPHDQRHDLAFYAYDSDTNQIALRLVSVEPLDHGRFQVTVRTTPDRAPRISTYDDHGELLKRQLADGRVLLRTTPDQLRQIWHIPH